jgi:hypothetical protein
MIATRQSTRTNRSEMTFTLTPHSMLDSHSHHPASSASTSISPPPCPPSWIGQIPLPCSDKKQRDARGQVWRNVSRYAPRAREKSTTKVDAGQSDKGRINFGLKPQVSSASGEFGSRKSQLQSRSDDDINNGYGYPSVTVIPVLSPPTSSYTSSSSSISISTSSSSSLSSPNDLALISPSTGRPRGSFWAQCPARPTLPHSRGRGRLPVRGYNNNNNYKYNTPLPSPYSPSDLDDDDDDDEDGEDDEVLRVKSQKWFLAPPPPSLPLPQIERAASGSTIVRSRDVSSTRSGIDDVSSTTTANMANTIRNRNRARRTACERSRLRLRFKLFPLEDDAEDKTDHQERNEEVLGRLLREPEEVVLVGSDLADGGEVAWKREGNGCHETRLGARSRGVEIQAHEWPLCSSSMRHEEGGHADSHPGEEKGPLAKHVEGENVCWRARHPARYASMTAYRNTDAFQSFKSMSDLEDPALLSVDTSTKQPAFSVQLSVISEPSYSGTLCSAPEPCLQLQPPRRRSDGDLLRKRVLEWNMVLNGKVSNVRLRKDKEPRDHINTRRSSCPAKLGSAVPTREQVESEEDEVDREMGEGEEVMDRREFQNR